MKKLIPLLIILMIMIIIVVVIISMAENKQPVSMVKNNIEKKALPLKVNFTNDAYCKMLITTKRNSMQVVSPDGKTWFFDDPGCMVLWLQDKSFKEDAKLWVYTIDTKKWIDAKRAWYGVKDKTEMYYGFGARENQIEGSIDYTEMEIRMLRGENLSNPKIRKKLLGE